MEKSISDAFLYMFKDKDWPKKAGILAFSFFFIFAIFCKEISIFPMLIKHNKEANLMAQTLRIVSPVVALINVFISGYLSKCTQNVIKNNGQEDILLPNWQDDFFNYFIIGAKRITSKIGIYILLLPTIFLLGIPIIIFEFLCIPLGKIFCSEFKFDSYFKWKEAYKLIKNNVGLYIWILLIMLIINILSILLFVVLFYFKIPSGINAIILAIITTYSCFVFAYLVGIVGDNKKLELES